MSITSPAAAVLVIALLASVGCRQSAPSPPSASSGTGTVTIEINADEKTETVNVANVAAGTTVEEVMRRVEQIPITIHGRGVTAFVDRIGETETGGKSGWTYKIDGKFANQGIGATTVDPPVTITWTFGDYSQP